MEKDLNLGYSRALVINCLEEEISVIEEVRVNPFYEVHRVLMQSYCAGKEEIPS